MSTTTSTRPASLVASQNGMPSGIVHESEGFDRVELSDKVHAAPAVENRKSSPNAPDASALQHSESQVVAALQQAGYRVQSIEFEAAETIEDARGEPRLKIAYVDRPLAGYRMEQIEKRAIIDTLQACGGNQAQAARQLGISEKTVYNKLRQYRRRGGM